MRSDRHKGKTLFMTTLAIGCMALVLLWPQWRDELRAQTTDGSFFCCRYTCAGFDSLQQQTFLGSMAVCLSVTESSECPADLTSIGVDADLCAAPFEQISVRDCNRCS
jgi:hypothetical protein